MNTRFIYDLKYAAKIQLVFSAAVKREVVSVLERPQVHPAAAQHQAGLYSCTRTGAHNASVTNQYDMRKYMDCVMCLRASFGSADRHPG